MRHRRWIHSMINPISSMWNFPVKSICKCSAFSHYFGSMNLNLTTLNKTSFYKTDIYWVRGQMVTDDQNSNPHIFGTSLYHNQDGGLLLDYQCAIEKVPFKFLTIASNLTVATQAIHRVSRSIEIVISGSSLSHESSQLTCLIRPYLQRFCNGKCSFLAQMIPA